MTCCFLIALDNLHLKGEQIYDVYSTENTVIDSMIHTRVALTNVQEVTTCSSKQSTASASTGPQFTGTDKQTRTMYHTISDKTLWTKYKNKLQVQCIRPPHPLSMLMGILWEFYGLKILLTKSATLFRVGEGGSWFVCPKHFYISF